MSHETLVELGKAAAASETLHVVEVQQLAQFVSYNLMTIRVSGRTLENWTYNDDHLNQQIEAIRDAVQKIEDILVATIRNAERVSLSNRVDYHNMVETIHENLVKGRVNANAHPLTDQEVRKQVYELTGGTCTYCGTKLPEVGNAEDKAGNFCVEHVVPTSQGGPNNIANYVPACISCNSAKGDRHVLHFVRNVLPRRLPQQPSLAIVKNEEGAA